MRTNRCRRAESGFSLIELLIVIAIILIILTIAVPKLANVQANAREMAAIRAVQAVNQAETQYMSQFGKYAVSLAQLGPPASGAAGPAASDLIQSDLASGTKGGYKFTLSGTPAGYTIIAVPETFGTSGRRTFYSDQAMVVHENWGQEPATAQSPELGSAAK